MKKQQDIYKGYLDPLSEFDHRYACWASNHGSWSRAKRRNKKIAKKRAKRKLQQEIKAVREEMKEKQIRP